MLPCETTFSAPRPGRGRARLPEAAKKLRFAPGLGKGTSSTRAVTAAQSTAASSPWGNSPLRNDFFRFAPGLGKGTTPRGCGKTPFRAGSGEGHEFHSCRNRRPINSGFQPLGEFSPAKRLFPFRADVEKGTSSRGCEKNPLRAGLGKGTSSTRAVNAARSTAASSRWGNSALRNDFFRFAPDQGKGTTSVVPLTTARNAGYCRPRHYTKCSKTPESHPPAITNYKFPILVPNLCILRKPPFQNGSRAKSRCSTYLFSAKMNWPKTCH